jgi:hypothetical protein
MGSRRLSRALGALITVGLCAFAPAALAGPAAPARPRIEVAFVLDATGSMGPYIDDARSRIRTVAADLSQGEPRPDVRYALVAYRDKGDDFVTRITPFTGDVSVMHAALTQLGAEGGGDTPEAALEALRDALEKLKWSPVAPKSAKAATPEAPVLRLVYLIGDAAPQHYADSPSEDALAKLALRKGITVQSIICGDPGPDGRGFFERVAAHSEGRAVSLADAGRRAEGGGVAATGAHAPAPTVGGTISGTTQTYAADMLAVDFAAAAGAPVRLTPLATASVARSGLSGALLRPVTDAVTFSDLWRAHVGLSFGDGAGDGPAPSPPSVDFSRMQVLVAGGADAGLNVTAVQADAKRGLRVASVAPAAPGVRFFVVPAGAPVVAAVSSAASNLENGPARSGRGE